MSDVDLKGFALLTEFGDEDREVLAELLEEKSLQAGRRVFSEGSEAEGLVLIASGQVRIESRRTGAVETVETGSSLGALSLVSVGPREATAIANTPCRLLLLPRSSWRRLVEDYPRTACRLAEAILDEYAGLLRAGVGSLVGR